MQTAGRVDTSVDGPPIFPAEAVTSSKPRRDAATFRNNRSLQNEKPRIQFSSMG